MMQIGINSPRTTTWVDRIALPLLVAVAAGLVRCINIDRAGFSQWDEGVFAWEAEHFARSFASWLSAYTPQQSPPLSSWLMGLVGRLWGTADVTLMLVNIIFAGATAGLVFSFLDRHSTRLAAWIGAALLALCQLHIVYSRTALADVQMTFYYLAGFWLSVERLRDAPSIKRLIWTAFGLAIVTLLAMYTKYYGILILMSAVFFEVVANCFVWIRNRTGHKTETTAPRMTLLRIGTLAILGLIVFLGWLPWTSFVALHFGPNAMTETNIKFISPEIFSASHQRLLMLAAVMIMWSLPLVLLFFPGLVRSFQQRNPWFILAIGWAAAYIASLLVYTLFIRLLVPMTGLLTLCAGAGVAALWSGFGKHQAVPLTRAIIILILALAIWQGYAALRWRADGYKTLQEQLIAAYPQFDRAPPSPPLVIRLAHPARMYISAWNYYTMLDPAMPIDEYGRHFFLLTDYTLEWETKYQTLFEKWKPYSREVARFPNYRPLPIMLCPPWRSLLGALRGAVPPPPTLSDFVLYEIKLP